MTTHPKENRHDHHHTRHRHPAPLLAMARDAMPGRAEIVAARSGTARGRAMYRATKG
ncbi:MAG: hypothetical protein M3R63_01080 [Actinomycetota bacterium]|nr:hypothetical protein [Actinomycetota bacterium]